MTDITRLTGTIRTEFGKGAARRARRAGLIPAVIYSADIEPIHVDLPGHDTFLIIKDNANALVTIDIDGKEQLTLVKAVQRHPVRRDILHVDLLAVQRGEKVDVEVPLVLTGESAPGTVVNQEYFSLLVQASATDIPENIELSVEGLEEGAVITAADVTLPQGATMELDAETIIASVVLPAEEPVEEPAEEVAEGEAEADDAE